MTKTGKLYFWWGSNLGENSGKKQLPTAAHVPEVSLASFPLLLILHHYLLISLILICIHDDPEERSDGFQANWHCINWAPDNWAPDNWALDGPALGPNCPPKNGKLGPRQLVGPRAQFFFPSRPVGL